MSYTEFMVACMFQVKRFYCEADYNFYNHLALTPGLGDSSSSSSSDTVQAASSAALSHTGGFRVGGGVVFFFRGLLLVSYDLQLSHFVS